jgi:hypothetical protein
MRPQAQKSSERKQSGHGKIPAGRDADAGQFLSPRRGNVAARSFDEHFAQLML